MSTPEGDLKAAVVKYLKGRGVWYLRINSGIVRVKGGFLHCAAEGTADILVFIKGEPNRWIELKAPGQKTARERAVKQTAFAEAAVNFGHLHRVCKSVEEVAEFLGEK